MISLEKRIILTPFQKLPKNVRDLGKLIVAKGFKKLPKVQKIAQLGHTPCRSHAKAITISIEIRLSVRQLTQIDFFLLTELSSRPCSPSERARPFTVTGSKWLFLCSIYLNTFLKLLQTTVLTFLLQLPVANLLKHSTIVIYNCRVVLTKKLPIIQL